MVRYNLKSVLPIIVCLTPICFGETPAPGASAEAAFAKIIEQVRLHPHLGERGLAILQAVAENQVQYLTDNQAGPLGFEAGDLQLPNYRSNYSRTAAFAAIGDLGTPEAISYLESFTVADFAADEVHELWPAARIALRAARLADIPDGSEETRYLEATIENGTEDAFVRAKMAHWAEEQLCNKGALTSLPIVQKSIRARMSGSSGQDQVLFCELRMRTVASDSDRIAALGSVLQLTGGVAHPRLTRWAISELTAMKSSRADEAMESFERQILALPDGSPQKRELMPYADAIYHRNGMRLPRQP